MTQAKKKVVLLDGIEVKWNELKAVEEAFVVAEANCPHNAVMCTDFLQVAQRLRLQIKKNDAALASLEKAEAAKKKPKHVKPVCQLIGEDANIFFIIGRARKALQRAGLTDEAEKMSKAVGGCGSYEAALQIISDYVEVQ